MTYDFIIAGAGLSGSVFARIMAEQGHHVLILERRNHIAGNAYDEKNEAGILIHKYGPHIFHTNDENVYQFVNRFSEWIPFKLKCEVEMCGKSTPSPFNFKTIDQFYEPEKASLIKQSLLLAYPDQVVVTVVELLNSDNTLIREYAQMLFDNDYSLYTAKQWGISPSQIDISVLKRVPVRLDYESMYFTDKYECMPQCGYMEFVKKMITHPNITVRTNADALDMVSLSEERLSFNGLNVNPNCYFVYTGPIDRLFNYKFGELPYRSLRFDCQTLPKDSFQNAPVVAYPQVKDYTRITEYKKLPVQEIPGKTTIAVEYPLPYNLKDGTEPYYPIPTETNSKIYQQYIFAAAKYSNLILCGRLAEYKYYNMDQAIASVLKTAQKYI